jgi:hypothetical protein
MMARSLKITEQGLVIRLGPVLAAWSPDGSFFVPLGTASVPLGFASESGP